MFSTSPTDGAHQEVTLSRKVKGWLASDMTMKCVYPEMIRRAKQVEEHPFDNSGYVILEDEITGIRWVKQVY